MNYIKKLVSSLLFLTTPWLCIASGPAQILAMKSTMIMCKKSDSDRKLWITTIEQAKDNNFKKLEAQFKAFAHTPQDHHKATLQHIPCLTPGQAHQAIENNIAAIFDEKDSRSISEHLEQIENHCQYLDPIKDKDAIRAIHLILNNQDRSGTMSIPFWLDAWYGTKTLQALPIPQKIRNTPPSEMLSKIRDLPKKFK